MAIERYNNSALSTFGNLTGTVARYRKWVLSIFECI